MVRIDCGLRVHERPRARGAGGARGARRRGSVARGHTAAAARAAAARLHNGEDLQQNRQTQDPSENAIKCQNIGLKPIQNGPL